MPTDGQLADTLPQDESALARALELSTTAETPPSSAPGYQIVRRLGAGKFGSVWLARDQNTGKHVAIKFYAHRRGVDWSLLGREVEKLAVLYTSRNIVRLLAVGWDHDPPYYVMEYLASGSLAQRLELGPLPVAEAVQIAKRVAQALVHAHGSGILHCDLKPANVLLDQDGEPRLCDFGQSRLADERSHSLGTLFYMAPEQADLKAVPDARWDVYALGALLYHMLSGHPPYRTEANDRALRQAGSLDERLQLYQQIVARGPRPTAHRRVFGVDGLLAEIVDRCLSLDPARRFANTQAVLDKLNSRERFRARRPLILMGLVLPLLLLLALLPFALDALHAAESTSRSNLIQRALESNALSANLLADGIQRELRHRLNELESIAEQRDVRAAILEFGDQPRELRGPMIEILDRVADQAQRRRPRQRMEDASWFFQDAAACSAGAFRSAKSRSMSPIIGATISTAAAATFQKTSRRRQSNRFESRTFAGRIAATPAASIRSHCRCRSSIGPRIPTTSLAASSASWRSRCCSAISCGTTNRACRHKGRGESWRSSTAAPGVFWRIIG